MPRITVSDATQRSLWENLRDLRDFSEEMALISLREGVSEMCKSALSETLYETSQRYIWDALNRQGNVSVSMRSTLSFIVVKWPNIL